MCCCPDRWLYIGKGAGLLGRQLASGRGSADGYAALGTLLWVKERERETPLRL